MPHASRTRRYRRLLSVLLVGALALAAALRFVGLGFGRGVLTPRPDEELIFSGVLIALTGDLNPHYAVWGHLFHDLYATVAAVWLAVQVGTGHAASWIDAVAAVHCEPWAVVWLGRAISASAGVLTLAATYHLARRGPGGRLGAAGACILLSTLFLHVRDCHFAVSDALLTLGSTAALAALAAPGRVRAGRAGFWTGLALATKLLALTVVLTFLTLIALDRGPRGARPAWTTRLRQVLVYFAVAAAVALVVQPFLVLDPIETWQGISGDLFNPQRRPFEHGISLRNASIIVRYYVPQAMSWPLAALAVAGGLHLLGHLRSRPAATPVVFAAWSLAAVLSVQRIFLRYLDPLLPVACVLAAHAIGLAARAVRRGRPGAGRRRLGLTVAGAVVVAALDLGRDVGLDRALLQPDTRALAGQWIERNVPSGSRIAWSGFGQIAPFLTMPWFQAPPESDARHRAARAARGLPTAVDDAIARWKRDHQVRTYWVVGVSFGPDQVEQSGLQTYPLVNPTSDLSWLRRLDRRSRQAGLLRRESPRWDLMRRHLAGTRQVSPETLAAGAERLVVVTGMPCDPAIVRLLKRHYDQVQVFDPGVPWAEYGGAVMYDLGDAWYVPNRGIRRVVRPGPQIRVFQRTKERSRRPP